MYKISIMESNRAVQTLIPPVYKRKNFAIFVHVEQHNNTTSEAIYYSDCQTFTTNYIVIRI